MESDNEVNGSSGDDDDGLLDEDIAGGEDDILDDTELDYTEDILEEANEEQVVNDEKVSSLQDCSQCVSEPSSPLDIEEGEISSEEETTDKSISLSVKLKNRATDKTGKIKTKKIRFTGMSSKSLSLSNSSSNNSMVCRHYLAGTCDWGQECRFYHPPRGIVQGTHGDRHFPLYPPPDMLHHMGHPPEFLGPAAAVHFHPPMMPMPPHIIPGPGMPPVPHPQFGAPFHPVPMIPFHEPWRLPPPGPHHVPPFREHYERMAVEAGKHGSQLEESATWVRLKTKVSRADYHGDLRSKLKGVPAMDDQSESDSDEGARRNRKVDKKSKKKSSNGLSDAKQKNKKTKKTHSCNKRMKKDEDRNNARYSNQEVTVNITKKDSRRSEEKNKSPPAKRLKEDKQKKRYSSEEGFDVTPPNLSPSSPGAHDFGSSQLDSSDALMSKKKNDLKWSFKIGDEKQRRLQEELKVVDNAIKRKIAAKRR